MSSINYDKKSQSAAADVALNRRVQGGDFCIASGFPTHGIAQQLCLKRSQRIIIGSGTSRLANTPGTLIITYSVGKDFSKHSVKPLGLVVIWGQVRTERNLICRQLPAEALRQPHRVRQSLRIATGHVLNLGQP